MRALPVAPADIRYRNIAEEWLKRPSPPQVHHSKAYTPNLHGQAAEFVLGFDCDLAGHFKDGCASTYDVGMHFCLYLLVEPHFTAPHINFPQINSSIIQVLNWLST
jgi:hypothetical protein